MTLHHRRQRHLYGCMYHSLFALTGDETWLEHVDDLSEPRWLARLHGAGATVLTYYADLMTDTQATPEFWQMLRSRMTGEEMSLLVTCDGLSGMRHVVAVHFPALGEVAISDSAMPKLQTMPFAEFLSSSYSRANQVQQILNADLDAHQYESGAEYVSQIDAAPYAPM